MECSVMPIRLLVIQSALDWAAVYARYDAEVGFILKLNR